MCWSRVNLADFHRRHVDMRTKQNKQNTKDQKYVFDTFGKRVLDNAWNGYHCCLFAYGQTGGRNPCQRMNACVLPGLSRKAPANEAKLGKTVKANKKHVKATVKPVQLLVDHLFTWLVRHIDRANAVAACVAAYGRFWQELFDGWLRQQQRHCSHLLRRDLP